MKKSEFINWRTHQTLNEVTKSCIQQYEDNYNFDQYLDDRSKKDNKFVNPLKDEDEEEKEDKPERERAENEGSEFSFSEEDEEMSHNNEDAMSTYYERGLAENFYKRTKDEIEQKYFVI